MSTSLNEVQRDALRELANVAAGRAASVLSRRLAGERVHFQPPEARSLSPAQLTLRLGGEGAARVAAGLEVDGPVQGVLWLVFALEDAAWLAAQLLGDPGRGEPGVDEALGGTAREALAAAVQGMGRLTGLCLQPASALLRRCSAPVLAKSLCREPSPLVLEAHLQGRAFTAEFLFLPLSGTLEPLLLSLRVG
ncbi:MAG: chemotaxis protein CheC [Myxococcaceae bacterium]